MWVIYSLAVLHFAASWRRSSGRRLVSTGCFAIAASADNYRVNVVSGDFLGDGAQGHGLAGAGGDLVAVGAAEIALIRAGQDQAFLLSDEVHHGLNLLLAGAWVYGLKLDPVYGGGDGFPCGQVSGFEEGVKV